MKNWSARTWFAVNRFLREQKGSGIIDYLAVGIVILGLMFAIAAALNNNGSTIADSIAKAISRLIDKIQY